MTPAHALHELLLALAERHKEPVPSKKTLENGVDLRVVLDALEEIETLQDDARWCDSYR